MGGGALAKVGEVAVKHCRSLAVGEVGFVVGAEVSKMDAVTVNTNLGLPFISSCVPMGSFVF